MPAPVDRDVRPVAAPDAPPSGDTWVALSASPLPTDAAAWAVQPATGALVTFCGTARDHAEGRTGVQALVYEAYEQPAIAKLHQLADEARRRWPAVARIALWHRVGELALGDVAVLVAVTAPHRAEAFDAARWCIDTLKATVPIWKRERWASGEDWGTGAEPLRAIATEGAGQ